MSYLRKGAHRHDEHKASCGLLSDAVRSRILGGALRGRRRIQVQQTIESHRNELSQHRCALLAPAAQTALARRAQRQRMKPARPFHHSAFNNGRKIANIRNSTRQTHRQNNVPAFFDYCPLRHSSRQLRPTKSHFMLPRCTGLLSYIRPASTQIINPVPPLMSHAPPALPGALLPPPALHPSPVAALAPFILKLLAHFCARA